MLYRDFGEDVCTRLTQVGAQAGLTYCEMYALADNALHYLPYSVDDMNAALVKFLEVLRAEKSE